VRLSVRTLEASGNLAASVDPRCETKPEIVEYVTWLRYKGLTEASGQHNRYRWKSAEV
jgi:hypothetical protein